MLGKITLLAIFAAVVAAAASPAGAVTFIHGASVNTFVPPTTTTSIVDEFAGSGMAAADDGVGTMEEVIDTGMLGSMMPRMFPLSATDPSAMPEPQAWALMLAGFTTAGALLRSRRRRMQFTAG